MKRFIFATLVAVMAVSCYDDSSLLERMDDYESRLTELETTCSRMNSNISSLQAVVEAVQGDDGITGFTPVYEGGVEVGYKIGFRKGGEITIYHGKKGEAGVAPVIGVKQDTDDIYYWTVDNDWVTDAEGNKIKAAGGAMPELMVEGGVWYASYDNGASWEKIGESTEQECDNVFSGVVLEDGYVVFTLVDGTTFRLPKLEEGVRNYYLDEIAKTKASVNDLITEPCLVFPMITDIHYKNSAECPDLIDMTIENMVALSKDIRFDFFVSMGDIVHGNLSQDGTEQLVKHLYDQFERVEAPFYPCIGNHDDNRYKSTYSHSQLHRIYMRHTLDVMFDQTSMCGTNYYKDFYGLGVRCIFLNANDSGEYGFSNATCEWFEQAVKTDYDIYAFSHISPVQAHQYNQTAHKNDERIVAAIKGAPTFKMFFNGHSHFDSEFTAPFNDTNNPFLAYSLCCNKFQNGTPDDTWPSQAVRPERVLGTVSEDCFDIVVIRPKSGKVNTVRFGAGVDKEFDVNTGESLGESAVAMLPEQMEVTLDFSNTWPFAEECVATTEQSGSREKYTVAYGYKYNGTDKTRNLTFTLGSTNWTSGRVYSYENIPDRSDKGLYFHGTHGGIILPGIPGMYLSSVSLIHYDKNSKGVRYAIQEGCEGNEGNRKLSGYFASGTECLFNMPVAINDTTSVESVAGKPYVIQVRDAGGYISTVNVVYTKTKPGSK